MLLWCLVIMVAAIVSGVLCVYYVNKTCWHKCPQGPAEHYTNVYILAQQFIWFTTGKTWFLRNLKKKISEYFILNLTPPCWKVSSLPLWMFSEYYLTKSFPAALTCCLNTVAILRQNILPEVISSPMVHNWKPLNMHEKA